ncbi:MAG TPA: ABC transporter ATP-binding protein, partial [Puia sp.]|nr:ABC transporter ATP-binding protein [Puia sp.]
KQYRLGDIGTGSLSHDFNRWWHSMRGKEDPYLKIGEENERSTKGTGSYVWALQDLNFEIEKGDALGIIGRNGAGKSTLLKILSKTTAPTKGRIKIRGKIASLLEVGTGFHPDLSGRENIFLNGAILGMTKTEIKRKFDEIVDFAGIERYIDTPVKRYSSGMYVRLAFGVAAHLEPDILIVDEVLAVGDAEFQKKALGKMESVSAQDGRTVIFVSHNMTAVKQLCSKLILMKNGKISFNGTVNDGIKYYLQDLNVQDKSEVVLSKNSDAFINKIRITDENNETVNAVNYNQPLYVEMEFILNKDFNDLEVSICFKNSSSVNVFFTSLSELNNGQLLDLRKGTYLSRLRVNGHFLIPDNYYITTYVHLRNNRNIDLNEDVLMIKIIETGSLMAPYGNAATNFACVFADTKWELKNAEISL